MKAEYQGNEGFLQRDSVEHKGYAEAYSIAAQNKEETDGTELLERILDRDNLNHAYKRVKANKGAPGIDGMTIEGTFAWLKEHKAEWVESIRTGEYKPSPVRRREETFPRCWQIFT